MDMNPAAPNTETETVELELFNLGLLTPSQKVFGALGISKMLKH